MKAETYTLQEVLQGERRFVVPVYQRPYVWERERQWEPLWEDVEATAIRLAETLQAAHHAGKAAPVADDETPPHFLGAIVVERFPTGPLEIKTRLVVDGQQRLITLQLLLMGALDALRSSGTAQAQLAQLRKLTRNDEGIWSGDDVHKVWPRQAEADSYRQAIAEDPRPREDSVFAAARDYFFTEALGFLEDEGIPPNPYAKDDSAMQHRASLLLSSLMALVKIVIIDLEDVDDAQVIFEALNARNTPLSATDLVKNLLFMRAQTTGHDPQQLYESVWSRFDEDADWWRERIGAGHARRARQDWLAGDWLIAQRGSVINVGRLYGEFRSWLRDSDTTAIEALHELRRYADAYEELNGRMDGATDNERLSFQRIDRLGVTVATPLLLWLLTRRKGHLEAGEREMAFCAIESFVIRRMATKAQTRAYGQAFVEVLHAAQEAKAHPGHAIVDALREGPHGYPWPTDADLAKQFRRSSYYGPGGVAQYRLRLLFSAIDEQLQHDDHHKGEPIEAIEYDRLQVEHVLPRKWKKYWPVEASDSGEKILLEQDREEHIHRIGNLTLVSGSLNLEMSNDPWKQKAEDLKEHSFLRLNARLRQEKEWNERTIRRRGEWLAEMVSWIWPGPTSDLWPGTASV